jgi:hypothetical protein
MLVGKTRIHLAIDPAEFFLYGGHSREKGTTRVSRASFPWRYEGLAIVVGKYC